MNRDSLSSGRHQWVRRCKDAPFHRLVPPNYTLKHPSSYLSNSLSLETVWKFSGAGQPFDHQTYHGRVDERFRAGAQPLVILTHPAVLTQPRERTLHLPPAG